MIIVILAGGIGSRLWPASHENNPKQFMLLPDGNSLLQATVLRALATNEHISGIITVINTRFYERAKAQYNAIKLDVRCDFVLESSSKNTAAAILVAALFAQQYYSATEPLLILPADHLISKQHDFSIAVTNAVALAQLHYLVTFGINADYPETQYGYIEAATDTAILQAYPVKRFVEKPTQELAVAYVLSGKYLWNSGMFCAHAELILAEYARYQPQLLHDMQLCLDSSFWQQELLNLTLNAALFDDLITIAFDYAICEQTQRAVVLPCTLGWSDIGSWHTITQMLSQDQHHNATNTSVSLQEVHNCTIYSDMPQQRLIVAAGISDLIIVDSTTALLIMHK